jgi:hypothetical protein
MVKRSAFWSLVAVAVGVFAWPTSAQDIPNPPDLWTESSADVGIKSSQASEWSIGTADFRISDMGGTGDTAFGGRSPSVAYNSTDSEFLVVWWGDARHCLHHRPRCRGCDPATPREGRGVVSSRPTGRRTSLRRFLSCRQ